MAGSLNNILGTGNKSEDEDSDSGLENLILELEKYGKIDGKIQ